MPSRLGVSNWVPRPCELCSRSGFAVPTSCNCKSVYKGGVWHSAQPCCANTFSPCWNSFGEIVYGERGTFSEAMNAARASNPSESPAWGGPKLSYASPSTNPVPAWITRKVPSTSWSSSRSPDQWMGKVFPTPKSAGVLRGPSGKPSQVLPSMPPSRWQVAQEIQRSVVRSGTRAALKIFFPSRICGSSGIVVMEMVWTTSIFCILITLIVPSRTLLT